MKSPLLLMVALPALSQMHSVAGLVVDASTGAPMKRVRVTLNPSGRNLEQSAVITKEDGSFSFEVPKGKFELVSEYQGNRQPFGQSGPGLGFNVAIITGPDQATSNLVFKWYRPGAISGKVVDERNQPVEGALVQLIRSGASAGRKTRTSIGTIRTDDRGYYRFGNCAAGSYFLAVTGEPWYAKSLTVTDPTVGADSQPIRTYLPTYYPNALDPRLALALELAPGADGIADFRLSTATGANLHVHVENPIRQVLLTLVAEAIAGVNTFQRQEWMSGKDKTLVGVLPGRYELCLDDRNGVLTTAMARRFIEVGSADLKVDLALTAPPSVAGKVTFSGKRPSRSVYVRLTEEVTKISTNRALDANNEFNFQTARPGRNRIQIGSAEGVFARTVNVNGVPAKGTMIELQPGGQAQVEISASLETGSVKGLVMNGDKPAVGVLALLAPVEDKGEPTDYHPFQTDSDGSFDFQFIPAGNYILFAVERMDLEYMNPAVLLPHLAAGKPIRVESQTSQVQNISLAVQK